MKRMLTLLLAGLMLLALAACGEKDPAPTGDDGSNTDKKTTLRVAMECAYAPYNWMQPTDENGAVPISNVSGSYANGYDVMMAKLIAEKLGYDLEIVSSEWDGIVPATQSGSVDVAICGQSMTPDRMKKVDFTNPYYFATIRVVVPENGKFANAKSVADLDGANVTSQLNTIWNDICLPQIPNAKVLPGQKSAPAMIAALTSGRVEVIVTDKPTALAAEKSTPGLKVLEFTGEGAFKVSQDDINIGISTKKGNTELLDAINGVLADLTEDDFNRMMDEATDIQPIQKDTTTPSDDADAGIDADKPAEEGTPADTSKKPE